MIMPTFLPECSPILLHAISCFTVLCKNIPVVHPIVFRPAFEPAVIDMSNIRTISGMAGLVI
jgi:hypothetical protein